MSASCCCENFCGLEIVLEVMRCVELCRYLIFVLCCRDIGRKQMVRPANQLATGLYRIAWIKIDVTVYWRRT
jgi:hypothetical protein